MSPAVPDCQIRVMVLCSHPLRLLLASFTILAICKFLHPSNKLGRKTSQQTLASAVDVAAGTPKLKTMQPIFAGAGSP